MESELFRARVKDTADICLKTSRPKFFGFLSAGQAVLAKQILENFVCRSEFWGGYEGAERVMLGCFPEWADGSDFPVCAVTFTYRKGDSLSHRDFLGSLMALGITRETVGDILIEQGRAVAFVTAEIKDYILNQITKIGGTGVTVSEGCKEPLPAADRLEEFTDTCASERIDCVVSSLCGYSRGKAAEVISQGLVTVNSETAEKLSKTVAAGDVISVRGKGKFHIDSLETRTKKNRIVIKYKKYI